MSEREVAAVAVEAIDRLASPPEGDDIYRLIDEGLDADEILAEIDEKESER